MNGEFRQDLLHVRSGGLGAYRQDLADLRVVRALRQENEHLTFPSRELVDQQERTIHVPFALQECSDQAVEQRGWDHHLPVDDRACRRHEVL